MQTISNLLCLDIIVFHLNLAGAVFLPWPLLAAVGIVVGLLVLNWDVYRFFKTKRGLVFALMTIPWHWFYFLYSGLAFTVGYAGFKLQKIQKASRKIQPGGVGDKSLRPLLYGTFFKHGTLSNAGMMIASYRWIVSISRQL